jgi:hypothetical protein
MIFFIVRRCIRFRFNGAGRSGSVGLVFLSRAMLACHFQKIHKRHLSLFVNYKQQASDDHCTQY